MNKVILLGRLGNDAELNVTQGGAKVAKFSLATTEVYYDRNNAKQEKTQWHRCQMWGDRAEKLAQYLTKGKQIMVDGAIEYNEYEKDGVKTYFTNIKVFGLEFGADKRADSNGGNGGRQQNNDEAPPRTSRPSSSPPPADDLPPIGADDDIPF